MKSKIKFISFFLVIAMMLSFCLASCGTPGIEDGTEGDSDIATNGKNDETIDEYKLPLEEGYNQLTIYFKHNGSYDDCDIWMWLLGGLSGCSMAGARRTGCSFVESYS